MADVPAAQAPAAAPAAQLSVWTSPLVDGCNPNCGFGGTHVVSNVLPLNLPTQHPAVESLTPRAECWGDLRQHGRSHAPDRLAGLRAVQVWGDCREFAGGQCPLCGLLS